MACIIAVSNQKGGVGKTVTAQNLAVSLSRRNLRVLLIDFDPQASLTFACGIEPATLAVTVYDALLDRKPLGQALQPTSWGFDLVPSSIDLAAAEMELIARDQREAALKTAVSAFTDRYDFILIDCQPSLTFLTINAWAASDYVLVPVSDFLAVRGLTLLFESIQRTKRLFNPKLQVLGVLITRTNPRTIHSQEVSTGIREALNGKVHVFKTEIAESTVVKQSNLYALPLLVHAPRHPVAVAYEALTDEILEVIQYAQNESARRVEAVRF